MQVSKRQLASWTGLDRATITKRLDAAKLAPEKKARSHLYESEAALIAIYQSETQGLDLTAERARLAHWQGVKAELEAKVRQGELVPVDEVTRTWCDLVGRARAKLLALPSQLAPVVMATTDRREIEEAARVVVYEALEALAGDE